MSLGYSLASHLATLPTFIIALALVALLVHLKKAWLGAALFGLTVAVFIALSLPLTAHEFLMRLEIYPPAKLPFSGAAANAPQAIVVLGGGRYSEAPEYGGADTVSRFTLERLRYAAYLQRKTGLPLLVSGGSVYNEEQSEAELMRTTLKQDFGVPVTWIETRSHNTIENGLYSRELLRAAGIKNVYLVTHAWHMRRAVQAFVRAGLTPVPAPLGYATLGAGDRQVFGYLPSANALDNDNIALHEFLGYWWNDIGGARNQAP